MTRASALAQGARFRQRKLSTKQQLQILREDQVEKIDDEAQRNIPKVDTGVEKAEELVSSLPSLHSHPLHLLRPTYHVTWSSLIERATNPLPLSMHNR
jgi:hypothetical protein